MPKAKARQGERRRVAQACEGCRLSKRRCDGSLPCQICVHRGLQRQCIYKDGDKVSDDKSSSRADQRHCDAATASGEAATGEKLFNTVAEHPAEQAAITGRMVLNSRGERVYVNGASGLSLLHFLKITLKAQFRSPRFSSEVENAAILDSIDEETYSPLVDIDYNEKQKLIDCYFIATSGLVDIYEAEEVNRYLEQDNDVQSRPENLQSAALSLILAIGAQTRASSTSDTDLAVANFNFGRRVAFKERLENISIDLIRVFLLMAVYTIGASRRHAAIMHIGVAATTAIMLGLHDAEQYSKLPLAESSLRWRTYRSLLVTDITNATIICRPVMTPALTNGKPSFDRGWETDPTRRQSTCSDMFEICSIMEPVVRSAGQNQTMDARVILRKAEELIEWASGWKQKHPGLQATQHTLSSVDGHTSVAGKLHVSNFYYHSLVLLTRQSLVEFLADQILNPSTRKDARPGEVLDRMQQICIDSAVNMAHTCYEAHQAGAILNNQCHILRPTLFEAAFLLGFFIAVRTDGSAYIEDAFRKARKVLKFFAGTSSLAREFYKILTSLLEAVILQRNDQARKAALPRLLVVERLLEFESQSTVGNIAGVTLDIMPSSREDLDWSAEQSLKFADAAMGSDFVDEEWQIFANQLSGFLPLSSDSLGQLFDRI